MRRFVTLGLVGLLASLSGCATFGTNVSGDFSCRAPKGDCAPSHLIDAAATSSLAGASADAAGRPRIGVASDDTSRTRERTLRIVFPAHVDETGTLHDEAVAWAVIENPRWAAELRRKPGEDNSPPLMRQFKRQLRSARSADEQTLGDDPETTAPKDELDEASSLFPSPIQPSSIASPLVLPSTAREAVAGARSPAVEGFDMSPPLHDRTPRPHGEATPLDFPTPDAIAAAKAKSAPAPAASPLAKEPK